MHLLAVCLATGRLLVHALGLRRLRRLSADSAAASALLGAASWTVGFALLSGPAGLPARPATGGARPRAGRRGARGVETEALAGATPTGLQPGLAGARGVQRPDRGARPLPVAMSEGFAAGNDTFTYCAVADWLQVHGFGGAAGARPEGLVDAIAVQRREIGFTLGAAYPLAMAVAASGASTSLALYPAVSTLGLVLGLWALWWAMGISSRPPSGPGAAVLRFDARRGLNTVALLPEGSVAWRVTGLALGP